MTTYINNFSLNKWLLLICGILIAVTYKACKAATTPIVVDVVKDPINCTASAIDTLSGRYTYHIQVGDYDVTVIGYTKPTMQTGDLIELTASK